MTFIEIVTAIIIHLIVPATGLLLYFALCQKMKREHIPNPPTVEFFLIFATYGGLLLVLLTSMFWQWSGAASLGVLYLIFGAPFVMGGIAYTKWKSRNISEFHNIAYLSAIAYFIMAPIAFIYLIIAEIVHKSI